jgi:hypothetical protein
MRSFSSASNVQIDGAAWSRASAAATSTFASEDDADHAARGLARSPDRLQFLVDDRYRRVPAGVAATAAPRDERGEIGRPQGALDDVAVAHMLCGELLPKHRRYLDVQFDGDRFALGHGRIVSAS